MAKQAARLKMVHAAIELFHRNGVNATSVDDVLKKSGTGKSQFSHYFKSKAGLVRAAVQELSEIIQSGKAVTGYEINTWKDMETWFQAYIDFQNSVDCERSCPLGTIGNDLLNDDEEARQDLVAFLEWGRTELSSFFSKKVGAGELPKSVNALKLADLCLTTMQGGMLLTKIRRDTDVFSNAASQALSYIKLLRQQARRSRS